MKSNDDLFKSNSQINQALLNQIIMELKVGNYHRCRAMGISEDILKMIDCLPIDSIVQLAASPVVWAKISIDKDAFLRIIHNSKHESDRRNLLDKAIKLNASNKMLADYFGITSNIAALKRKIYDIPTSRGRLVQLTEEQKCVIWEEWKTFIDTNENIDNYLKLEKQIELAERYNLNLAALNLELETHSYLTKEDKTLLIQLFELKADNKFIQFFYKISNKRLMIKRQLTTPIDLRNFIHFEKCAETVKAKIIRQWQDLLNRYPIYNKDDLTLLHLQRLINFAQNYQIQFNSLCSQLITM